MAARKKKPDDPDACKCSLREDAEKKIAESPEISSHLKEQTTEQLINELWVHQVELETQAEELRRANLKLGEARDKYLDLYEFAPLGYLTLTHNAIILEVNLTGVTLLGAERSRLKGARFRKFIFPGDLDAWDRYFMAVRKQEKKLTTTLTIKRGDGTTFPARLEGVRLTSPVDKAITVRVGISDISDIRKMETELRKTNKNLTLLSSITRHDINNQLTVMRGYLSILKKKLQDPVLDDYLQKVVTSAEKISAMIQFTKTYGSIGADVPAWQDTRAIVNLTVKAVALGEIRLVNDVQKGREILADPLIVKVFYNLVDNAVRYGGTITRIRFSVEEHNSGHVIVCEDDGVGIPQDEKEQIFEYGFGKNTGLGLTLSREILDITGITIHETGVPGKGARFEMTVPDGAYRIAK